MIAIHTTIRYPWPPNTQQKTTGTRDRASAPTPPTLSRRTTGNDRTCIRGQDSRRRSKSTSKPGRRPAQRPAPVRLPSCPSWPTPLWGKQGRCGCTVWPASQHTRTDRTYAYGTYLSANWPRLTEAGGRPELDLALAGCAGGQNWPKPVRGCSPHSDSPRSDPG